MKDTFSDPNFPRTSDGRVYHLGLRHGEVANRILTVGDPSRARRIRDGYLDKTPKPFELTSERGFLTITGVYKGVPLSIVAIGMGIANMDFFVRECRECVVGDMAIIRLGSCGSLISDLPVGSLTIPKACVAVTRNYDYDFKAADAGTIPDYDSPNPPYRISKPVESDVALHGALVKSVETVCPKGAVKIITEAVNASADGFYGSQGRKTAFHDHNDGLMDALAAKGAATLEMETHHLFHLASVYPAQQAVTSATPPVLTRGAGEYAISGDARSGDPGVQGLGPRGSIAAAAVQIIFAERRSTGFIAPEDVKARENWAGLSCLEALAHFPLQTTHPDEGSVWKPQAQPST